MSALIDAIVRAIEAVIDAFMGIFGGGGSDN